MISHRKALQGVCEAATGTMSADLVSCAGIPTWSHVQVWLGLVWSHVQVGVVWSHVQVGLVWSHVQVAEIMSVCPRV